MIGRILATAVALILALCAFWFNALGAGHFINPFGIVFLFFSVLIWFAWAAIRSGYISARDESDVPIIRLGSAIIGGMRRTPRLRRASGTKSSPSLANQ